MIFDTVFALATPVGTGAIAIIRTSGTDALKAAKLLTKKKEFKPKALTQVTLYSEEQSYIDKAMIVYFKLPHSYTGEDIVEYHIHGSMFIVQSLFSCFTKFGMRMAEPGEFTKRAVVNSKIDLIQAEAINSLINASTPLAHKIAFENIEQRFSKKVAIIKQNMLEALAFFEASLDYPEEEEHEIDHEKTEAFFLLKKIDTELKDLEKSSQVGCLASIGITIAIIGKTNVGKSSFFNTVLEKERAIVSSTPGTTRDYIESRTTINSIPVTLIDMAGIRLTDDFIEQSGIDKGKEIQKHADMLIFVLDNDSFIAEEDLYDIHFQNKEVLICINKIDLWMDSYTDQIEILTLYNMKKFPNIEKSLEIIKSKCNKTKIFFVSVKNKWGIDLLLNAIAPKMYYDDNESLPYVQSLREKSLLEHLSSSIQEVFNHIKNNDPYDMIAQTLSNALSFIYDLTGENLHVNLYDEMFSHFCLGK